MVEVSPSDQEVHSKFGFLQASKANFSEPALHFRKAVELDAFNANAHFNLGQAYLKLNERQLAKAELQKACTVDTRYIAGKDRRPRPQSVAD